MQRLAPKLRSGNVSQMSFAFRVVGPRGEEWEDQPEDGGKPIRTLRELALFDVSPVTYPAYGQTDASLRCGIDAVAERRGLRLPVGAPPLSATPTPPAAASPQDLPGPQVSNPEASGQAQALPDCPTPTDEPKDEPPSEPAEPAARSTTLPERLALQLQRLEELERTLT